MSAYTKDENLAAIIEEAQRLMDENEDEGMRANQNESCNRIRGKIRKFLADELITQSAFLKFLGVNSNSYRRFMGFKKKWQGSGNGTFWSGLRFFRVLTEAKKNVKKKNKKAGKKAPKKKKKIYGNGLTADEDLWSLIQSIEEADDIIEDDTSKIYENCDEVRSKIKSFLKETDITQTGLASKILDVNSNAMRKFISDTGVNSGGASNVYWKTYNFFEKKRILEDKPKSNKRKRVESLDKKGTFDYRLAKRQRLGKSGGRVWVFAGNEAETFRRIAERQRKQWGGN